VLSCSIDNRSKALVWLGFKLTLNSNDWLKQMTSYEYSAVRLLTRFGYQSR